jgi:hypothetical protein
VGVEGIVSKRKGISTYRSGRWLKAKNLACAAVKRSLEEEDEMGHR